MRQVFYIVLHSWQDVLWRVVGWSENPYVANTYYQHYKKMTAQLLDMRSAKCENIIELVQFIRNDIGTDIQDLMETHLMTKQSKDGRCYVIYPSKYEESFNDDFMASSRLAICICDYLSKVVMTAVPLMKYIRCDRVVDEVLFAAYLNTSVRKMLQRGPAVTPVSKLIDVVYFWRCLTAKGAYQFAVSEDNNLRVPVEAVYVDIDCSNNYERLVI